MFDTFLNMDSVTRWQDYLPNYSNQICPIAKLFVSKSSKNSKHHMNSENFIKDFFTTNLITLFSTENVSMMIAILDARKFRTKLDIRTYFIHFQILDLLIRTI